jgi:poly(3-hydroxybutyrate) depolymerase
MKTKYFLLIFLFLLMVSKKGQIYGADTDDLIADVNNYAGVSIPYRLFVPYNYSDTKNYPLILRMHGYGAGGTDNISQMASKLAQMWINPQIQEKYPSFVVFPQCPAYQLWDPTIGMVISRQDNPVIENVNNIIDKLINEYPIDTNRIYVMGGSMGGHACNVLMDRYPNRWAAAMPVCGMTYYSEPERIVHIPVWYFHGKSDASVAVSNSQTMVSAFEGAGASFIFPICNFHTNQCNFMDKLELNQSIEEGAKYIYTEYENLGHELSDTIVNDSLVYKWLFKQNKNSVTGLANTFSETNSINCFPNPVDRSFNISLNVDVPSDLGFELFNSMGALVLKFSFNNVPAGNSQFSKDISGIVPGIYIYRLSIGQDRITGRLIKK